ncbi:isochorismatase family cysteine hydrolase [Dyella sp. A6]|uniref:cysteine hydrolase family protein n=1 Tax=Dyella aluminiiresistens TaxID=3069105 RepID=UPI002E79F6CE|nr:isochorismatase family cysteine hydrolase [Dyella sp. A6]
MALSTLDPRTALIVIDMQHGIVSLPCAHPMDTVIGHVAELVQAFRQKHCPVVLVNVTGGAPGRNEQPPRSGSMPDDWAELIPQLDQQASDHTVSKRTWGAFMHTDLHDYLQQQGVTQVVIAGVATSIGVESTARQAYELGYNVSLVTDAMTDLNRDAHENSVARVFPRLGEGGSTRDMIDLLGRTHG